MIEYTAIRDEERIIHLGLPDRGGFSPICNNAAEGCWVLIPEGSDWQQSDICELCLEST